jgi:hypothetical protein
MKSPFPGLDPYLEARWADVHQRLITDAAHQLGSRLPEDLRARVEERVFVETEVEQIRRIVPDLHVAQYHPARANQSEPPESGGIALAEPMVFLLEDEPITEGYIEIRERSGGKVITVIEFLSPANKSGGEGQKLYLEEQQQVLHSDTNLVEIDLVRSGQRVIAFPNIASRPSISAMGWCAFVARGPSARVNFMFCRCASACLRSQFHCDRAIGQCRWICRLCLINAIGTAATMILTTPSRPSRRWRVRTPPGRTVFSKRAVSSRGCGWTYESREVT